MRLLHDEQLLEFSSAQETPLDSINSLASYANSQHLEASERDLVCTR